MKVKNFNFNKESVGRTGNLLRQAPPWDGATEGGRAAELLIPTFSPHLVCNLA